MRDDQPGRRAEPVSGVRGGHSPDRHAAPGADEARLLILVPLRWLRHKGDPRVLHFSHVAAVV